MEARTLFIVGMYVVGSPVVAWVAKKRRRSPLKWFVAAVLTSPAMAFCAIFYVNPYYPDAGEDRLSARSERHVSPASGGAETRTRPMHKREGEEATGFLAALRLFRASARGARTVQAARR